MGRIYVIEQRREARRWRNWFAKVRPARVDSIAAQKKPSIREKRRLKHHLCMSIQLSRTKGVFNSLIAHVFIPQHYRHKVSFPKVQPHAPNTIQTPRRSDLSFMGRVKQRLWAFGARMKERDMKYAIKAGMATAMLAAPAFIEATRPLFMTFRGEWALISFFVVISPTIGAVSGSMIIA
jgi:hypothetical protein